MAKCGYCGSMILFGGKKAGSSRFCNHNCLQGGALLSLSEQIPEKIVQQALTSVHRGRCPECKGPGPVDVHISHRVWSLFLVTSWGRQQRLSCRPCGIRSQVGNLAFSLLLGWWGFPWGVIMTPVQVGRNVAAMLRGRDQRAPSADLTRLVRLNLAAQAVAQQEANPGS